MSLYASGVTIPADLSGAISGVGSPGYNAAGAIGNAFSASKNKLAQGASARGMNGAAITGPNSYAGNQAAVGQNLATGNLESALGQGLGNTAYQNTLAQRDFGQNEQLANETAALNKPGLLEQILSGVGNVGGTAARIYGAYGKNAGGGNSGAGTSGELPPSLSYIPGGSAYNYYMNGGF
jgi:hypothetical protein